MKEHLIISKKTISDRFYFAYGANMSLDSMAYRCPRARPVRSFFLRDWRLRLHNHATIEPSPGHSVPGALWRITPECEQYLDMFEGWPYYYLKQELEQDGVRFMVYVMNDTSGGSPTDGYVELLEEGYQDWNLPLEHLHKTVNLKVLYDL